MGPQVAPLDFSVYWGQMWPYNMKMGAVMGRGRKPVLTRIEKLAVGGECERLWQTLAEQHAMATYRTRPHLRDVKKFNPNLRQPRWPLGVLASTTIPKFRIFVFPPPELIWPQPMVESKQPDAVKRKGRRG